jgi:hypothetical protein
MSTEDPISYMALQKGAKVLDSTGNEFGSVEHVLQDSSLDLFDGLAVTTRGGLRFVDADRVETITSGAVHTTLSQGDIDELPKPQGNAVLEADPEEYQGNGLSAWFGRMFRREHWMRDHDE